MFLEEKTEKKIYFGKKNFLYNTVSKVDAVKVLSKKRLETCTINWEYQEKIHKVKIALADWHFMF